MVVMLFLIRAIGKWVLVTFILEEVRKKEKLIAVVEYVYE